MPTVTNCAFFLGEESAICDRDGYNSYMPLTIQEVEHIAHLARLELTSDEKNRYREQLSAILDHVAQLQKINTSSTHVDTGVTTGADDPLRVDEVHSALTPEELLSSASHKERSQFKIPPVFE
jgi:aspartyl-tRNA(Asn)/glutamyl-tRNA(Gln) amidotransferase subunit C